MQYRKAFILICLVILTSTLALDDPHANHSEYPDHKCIHDDIDHQLDFIKVAEDLDQPEGRVLASYPKMRMYPYYNLLKATPDYYQSYIQIQLVPAVLSYLQSALRIKHPLTEKLKLPRAIPSVCGVSTPLVLYTGVSADYFIVFRSEYNNEDWVANSGPCFLADGSKRPLIARITFNRRTLKPSNGNAIMEEKNAYVLMHELIHSLGFSKSLFPYFLDTTGKVRKGHIKTVNLLGSRRTVVNVPALTTKLRNFFGCSSLEGAYMEDDGGVGTVGSHFERRHFVYDTMASGVVHGRRVSQFTLGMLEASGWYVPDYNYAEPYFFGQGQGCGFLKTSCTAKNFKYDEFCTGFSRGCADHGRGGGSCSSDPSSDSCRYIFPKEEYDCENTAARAHATLPELQVFGRGAGSRCFSGTLTTKKSASTTSFCFKYTCSGSGSSTRLQVQVGSQKLLCKKKGKLQVKGYNGTIDCPDPLSFCNTAGRRYCPRNCMGRGVCRNNKCSCYKGFKGVDCGLKI